jgi:hypothetical protein
MPRILTARPGVLLAAFMAACSPLVQSGATDAVLRPADDPPVRFETVDGVMPEDGCRSPMYDPRDRTALRLARSSQYGMTYRGDYEAPPGRYGVRPGELLRIDCSTGEVIGIVRAG